MDAIDLPIKPRFDPGDLDRAIAKLKELESKGFTIPVNFVTNLETLKTDAEALVTRLKGQWQGLASDFSSGNAKLLAELDRLGESKAAARLRAGFASVREEVLVLDNLISQLGLKGDPGAGLAKGLAAGRIADLVKSGRAHGETVSFAGYGEQSERATTAQERFVAAEVKGVQAAQQSEAAIAAESAVLKAKALQFEEARAAAQRFQRAEAEQTAQTMRSSGATGADSALQRQRSAALIRNAGSDAALQRQRSAAYIAEQKRVADEETAEIKKQQSAADALQRQRSQALIRQQKEEQRLAATTGLRGIVSTAGTAATFIGTYGAIDLAIRALKGGAEASVEYERKLATLSIVFRGTKDEARGLAAAVIDQAAALGQDGIKALEVATDFARYGFTQAEVLEAVRVAMVAANVAQLDLAQSGKYLQAILSGYQLNVGQLSGVLGSLDTISHSYNVTNLQLLEGLSRVAPLAKQAGISLNELAAFEAVISGRSARPGSEAGNALKALLSRFEKPQVQTAIGAVGVSLTDNSGEFRNRSEVIRDLYIAYQKLGQAEREELLVKLAGTQQASRIQSLFDGYLESQDLAIRANRDLGRAERENLAVRETLSSQLGTLKTRWEQFWVAGSGAGQAAGVQGAITDTTKLLSNLLLGLTQLEKGLSTVAAAGGNAIGKTLGGGETSKEATILLSSLARGGVPAGHALDKITETASKLFPNVFKSDADRASEAVSKFNAEVDKMQHLAEANAEVEGLIKTFEKLASTATPDQLARLINFTSRGLEPNNQRNQQSLAAELTGLAAKTDKTELIARLEQLALGTHQAQVAEIRKANDALQQRITLKQKDLDQAEKAQPSEGKDKKIAELLAEIQNLRKQLSTGRGREFSEEEGIADEKAAALKEELKDLKERSKLLTSASSSKLSEVGELDKEALQIKNTLELFRQKKMEEVAAHAIKLQQAQADIAAQEQVTQGLLDELAARRQYSSVVDMQKKGFRRIDEQVNAYGDVTRAMPSVNRADELGQQRQLIDMKDQMLQMQRAKDEGNMRSLKMDETAIQLALANVDAQRQALSVERERVAIQERFAAMQDAVKRGVRNTQATNEFFGGVGKNETEKKTNLIRGLTDPRAVRDTVTRLPMNIAAAKEDFDRAGDPVAKARALAQLKEMGVSLAEAEAAITRRRFQVEAEITNERRKQAQEASKNLLLGDRETQLRAALAAKFSQAQGGKGFTADQFQFFDQKTKNAIRETNPELLPPELQNNLKELQDESSGLVATFRPLADAANAAAEALAKIQNSQPAINPGNASQPVTIDVSPMTAQIADAGQTVQTALDLLHTQWLDQFRGLADQMQAMASEIGSLPRTSLTARIGVAQGAASVLA